MKYAILLSALTITISSFMQKKDITWVAIGDSITYLNDHPDETGDRITKGYMTRVTEQLPYVHFTNQGHNGWTSGDIAESIDKLGLQKADVYSVFLGTNDWWQGRPLGTLDNYKSDSGNKTVYGSFRIIINKLRSLDSTAKIILITPMQRVDFVYINDFSNNAFGGYKPKNEQMLEQFADAVNDIATYEHFDVVDLYHTNSMQMKKLVNFKRLRDTVTKAYKNYTYPAFIDVPFDPKTDEYPYPVDAMNVTYDGLHPSDKGFTIIADKLVKIMGKY